LLMPIVEDLEIILGESTDRFAVLIEHNNVELHEPGRGPDGQRVIGLRTNQKRIDHRQQRDENDPAQNTHNDIHKTSGRCFVRFFRLAAAFSVSLDTLAVLESQIGGLVIGSGAGHWNTVIYNFEFDVAHPDRSCSAEQDSK
jgi:hypothetical protein